MRYICLSTGGVSTMCLFQMAMCTERGNGTDQCDWTRHLPLHFALTDFTFCSETRGQFLVQRVMVELRIMDCDNVDCPCVLIYSLKDYLHVSSYLRLKHALHTIDSTL